MNPQKLKTQKRQRRKARVRAKIFGAKKRPRWSVFRSSKHIYCQLIDDEHGKTLASASDISLKHENTLRLRPLGLELVAERSGQVKILKQKGENKKLRNKEIKGEEKNSEIKMSTKCQQAFEVGKYLAKEALEMNIKRCVFDKSFYKYHGRVKAVAEGAREAGLQF